MLLDALLLSHADADHAGGAGAVRRFFPALARYGPGDCVPRIWRWGPARFYQAAGVGASTNDRSCIRLVEMATAAGRNRVLLPGDIEAGAETGLILGGWPGDASRSIAADVLVVPHHGSTTSSTQGFLNRVLPRVAIVLTTATSGAILVRLAGSALVTESVYATFGRLWRPVPACIRRPDPRFCRTVH